MFRHNCLRNAQNIIAAKETLSLQSFHAEKKKTVAITIRCHNKSKKEPKTFKLRQTTVDLQQGPATKTQNSVTTQLLSRDREGNSRPKYLGIHT